MPSSLSVLPLIVVAAALVGMLVITGVASTATGVAYLLVPDGGRVAGMALVAVVIAATRLYAGGQRTGARRYVQLAAGVASACIGLVLAQRVGVVDGLFSATAHWTSE